MAKKIESKLDDFGFDTGLDDFDLDFDIKPVKDDRKPITKIASGIKSGAINQMKDESFISSVIKNVFPRGYGTAFDTLVDTKNSLKDLYNTAGNIIKPAINDAKRITDKALPTGAKYLPGSLYKQLEKFSSNFEKEHKGYSYQSNDDLEINQTLADIAKLQADAQERRSHEQDVKDSLKQGIDFAKHRESIGQLNEMRINLSQLVSYQNRVTSAYQKKSLELQYRQFFVARDALIEQKRFGAEMKQFLESINKNTALPDYVKLKSSERFGEAVRNRFLDNAVTGLFGHRDNFIKGLGSRLSQNLKASLGATVSGLREGMSMMESQMGSIDPEMASMIDPYSMGGEFGGQFLANRMAGARFGRFARGKINQIPGVGKTGNALQYYLNNIPQFATQFARSTKGSFGLGSVLVDPIKSAILQGRPGRHIEVDNIKNLQEPGIYTRQTNKTINEIIPGLLSRIHQELTIIRTGDTSIEAIQYDLTRNRFDTERNVKSNVVRSIINPAQKEVVGRNVEGLIDEIDPDKKLSPEARKALGTQLLHDNMEDRIASPERMTNLSTYRGDASKFAREYTKLFSRYYGNDPTGARRAGFSERYNDLGRFIGVDRGSLQNLMNAGLGNVLSESGLVSMGGPDTRDPAGLINLQNLFSYYYANQYNPSQTNINKGLRKGGFAPIVNQINQTPTYEGIQRESNITSSSGFKEDCCRSIVEAIQAINPLELLTIANTSLASIDAKLSKGVVTLAAGDISGEELKIVTKSADRETKNKLSILQHFYKGGKELSKATFRFALKSGKAIDKGIGSIFSNSYDLGKKAASASAWISSKAFQLAKGSKDLYKQGENSPVLKEALLKAGQYKDAATGTVIRTYNDIKGPVMDLKGNVILSLDDINNGIFTKNKWGILVPFKLGLKFGKITNKYLNPLSFKEIGKMASTFGKGAKDFLKWGMTGSKSEDEEQKSGKSPFGKILSGGFNLGKMGANALGKGIGLVGSGIGEGVMGFASVLGFTMDRIFKGKRIVSVLTQIRDILDNRLPGKKIRKGSYEDQQNQKKEQEAIEREEAASTGSKEGAWGNSLFGVGASALGKLFGKKKKGEDEEDSEGGFVSDIAGNALGGMLGGRLGKIGKGALKAGKWLGKKAFGLGGLAMAGTGMYDMVANGDFSLGNIAQTAGGLAMSPMARTALMAGASSLLPSGAIGGALISGAGALIGAVGLPVLLGGAALGALGYFGYKYFTRKTPETLSTVRFIQYGFDPSDEDRFRKILEFESIVKDAVNFGFENSASLEMKKVASKASDIAEIFGFSLEDPQAIAKFGDWLEKRFKPVYLTHLLALRKMKKEIDLADVDSKLSAEDKIKYLDATSMLNQAPSVDKDSSLAGMKARRNQTFRVGSAGFGDPFSNMTSPFNSEDSLQMTTKDVAQAVKNARAKLVEENDGKEPSTEGSQVRSSSNTSNVEGLGVTTAAIKTASEMAADASAPQDARSDSPNAATDTPKAGLGSRFLDWASGTLNPFLPAALVIKGGLGIASSLKDLIKGDKNYLLKIRMAEYGFGQKDESKYEVLLSLDKLAEKNIRNLDTSPELSFNDKRIIGEIYRLFKIDPEAANQTAPFQEWLEKRYAPVLFKYLKAIKQIGKSISIVNLDRALSKDEKAKYLEIVSSEAPIAGEDFNPFDPAGKGLPDTSEEVKALIDEALKHYASTGANVVKAFASSVIEKAGSFLSSTVDKVKNFFGFGDKKETPSSPSNINVKSPAGVASSTMTGSAAFNVANGTGIIDQYQNQQAAQTMPWAGGVRVLKGDGAANRKLMIQTAKEAGITDPKELAMLLAQLDHESMGFTRLEESFKYRPDRLLAVFPKYFKTMDQAQRAVAGGGPAIASIVYGNRMGNNGQGEGWTYRGRGFIQLTGKDNYTAASKALGIDLVNNPDLASTPEVAAKVAIWFWKSRGLSSYGQAGDVRGATKRINGGYNGLDDRAKLFGKYLSMVQKGELDDSKTETVAEKANNPTMSNTEDINAQIAAATNPALGVGVPDTTASGGGGYGGSTSMSNSELGTSTTASPEVSTDVSDKNTPPVSSSTPSSLPTGNLYGGFSPKASTSINDVASQQQTNSQSQPANFGGLTDSMKENVAVSKEILNVNSQQLGVLLQIAKLLSVTNSTNNQNSTSSDTGNKPSNRSSDISNTPIKLNKKFAA